MTKQASDPDSDVTQVVELSDREFNVLINTLMA